MIAPHSRRAALPMAALLLIAALALPGCEMVGETIDKIRVKVIGITVCEPERESAEWVIKRALDAATDKNAERGWNRFQKVLHTSEQTPNALRGWYGMGWKRMRRQAKDYLDEDGCFTIVDFKKMMSSRLYKTSTGREQRVQGIDYYVESYKKEMPTPCAVYIDDDKDGKWRIKRCSL